MEQFMKECGIKTRPTGTENLFILMEIFMKAIGKIIRLKDLADIKENQEDSMKAAGFKINLMGMG